MVKIIEKIKNMKLQPDIYIMRLFSALCISAMCFLISRSPDFTEMGYFSSVSIISWAVVFILVFIALSIFSLLLKKHRFDLYVLPVTFGIYSFVTLMTAKDWYFAFGFCALAAVLIFYYHKKGYFKSGSGLSKKKFLITAGVITAFFVLICGSYGVIRYLTYSTPNFDFGIFCNMFYNMRNSFRAVSTCERDGLLSHFAVHVSPVYYLLLPFYYIFPSPVTLQLAQTVILASAVIPVILISRHFGLSYGKTILLGVILLFHPAVFAGTNYDLHENCFLLPFLLWMFYFFEKEKYIPMAIFAALVLSVKEDAAVYVIFFAVFIFIARKKYLPSVLLAVGAVLYFICTLWYLSKYGNGVMSDRYGNYIEAGSGLIEVVKNILVNPAYVFTQLFVDNNGEYQAKVLFILQLFVPLAFMPLAVKKVSNLILLFPLLLINLMPVYVYQYDIGFQYAFAPLAFLLYAAIINLSEMKEEQSGFLIKISAVCACMLFVSSALPKASGSFAAVLSKNSDYQIMNEALEEIPEDASVICSTFLLPKLSQREEIYEIYYHENKENENIDYVIIDGRYNYKNDIEKYSEMGYDVTKTIKNNSGRELIIIMEK